MTEEELQKLADEIYTGGGNPSAKATASVAQVTDDDADALFNQVMATSPKERKLDTPYRSSRKAFELISDSATQAEAKALEIKKYSDITGLPPMYIEQHYEEVQQQVAADPIATARLQNKNMTMQQLADIGYFNERIDGTKYDNKSLLSPEQVTDIVNDYVKQGVLRPEEGEAWKRDPYSMSIWAVQNPERFYDMPIMEHAEIWARSASVEVIGTIDGIKGGMDWLVGDTYIGAAALEMLPDFGQWAKDIAPKRRTFLGDVVGGFASMGLFMGIGKGVSVAGRLAKLSKSASVALNVGTMTFTEAFSEAGGSYNKGMELHGDREQAEGAARISFWMNLPVLWLSNRVTFGTKRFGILKKNAEEIVNEAAKRGEKTMLKQFGEKFISEGGQEAYQAAVGDIAQGRAINVGGALYEGLIGGIVGGVTGIAFERATNDIAAIPELSDAARSTYLATVTREVEDGKTPEQAHVAATRELAQTEEGKAFILAVGKATESWLTAEASINNPDVQKSIEEQEAKREEERVAKLTDVQQIAEILGEDETITDEEAVDAVLSGQTEALMGEEVDTESLASSVGVELQPGASTEQNIRYIVSAKVTDNIKAAQDKARQAKEARDAGNQGAANRLMAEANTLAKEARANAQTLLEQGGEAFRNDIERVMQTMMPPKIGAREKGKAINALMGDIETQEAELEQMFSKQMALPEVGGEAISESEIILDNPIELAKAIKKEYAITTLEGMSPENIVQQIRDIVTDAIRNPLTTAQALEQRGNMGEAKQLRAQAQQAADIFLEQGGPVTEMEVQGVLDELAPKKVEGKMKPSEIAKTKLPASTEGLKPSKATVGEYYHADSNELQDYLDTHGDGFLYRVSQPYHFENGQDTGDPDYQHRFKGDDIAKTVALTSSLEDANQMLAERGNEGYTIYRILPADIATEFVIQIPSDRGSDGKTIHVHSLNPISVRTAEVVNRAGKEVEPDAGFRNARESVRRRKGHIGKGKAQSSQVLRADDGRGRGRSVQETAARNAELSKPPTKAEMRRARRIGALQSTGLDKSDIKLIREDEALKAAFTKAVQAARIAYREGKAAGTEQANMEALSKEFDLRAQALREKLTAEQVKERLNQRLQETRARAAQAIQEFRDKLETARAQARQANERRKAVEHLKRIKKSPLSSIDVEFQKRITAILDVLKLTKPSGIVLRESNKESVREAQAEAMAAIKEFGEWSTANKAAKVSPGRIEQLTRLGQIPTASLTDADMAEINKVISELYELGKVKRELKLVYQKAELDAEIAAAVGGTVNRDIKMAKKYRPTKLEEWQRGLRKAYMDTMTTARVTDWLDGVKGYKGYNTSWIKRFGIRERNAKVNHEAIVSNALQEIVDQTGVVEWTEEQQIDMMINIRAREGAWDAVAALMEHYKGITIPTLQNERGDTIIDTQSLEKIIPKIDQDQERAIGVLQKHMGENTDRLAALVEEITNKPFVKLDTYILPLKYEQQLDLDATKSVDQGMHRTTQTRQGFKYERQAGVKKLPRTDLFGIFSEGILDQQWYMELQPELEQARHIFLSKAYGDAAGELGATWWANQLDIIARRGWMSTATNSELLRLGRVNLNQAILGYRLSTILLQPMAVADMAAFMVPKYGVAVSAEIVKQFTRSWVVPGTSQEIIEGSKSLQHRQGGELAIEELSEEQKKFGKLRRWFTKNSMSLIQKADIKTAAGAWQAAKEILMKNGYSEAEASAEADFIMNLASGSTEITLRPQILARGEGARFWFTFGSFALNRWGIIVHDIGRAGIFKKGARNKARAITAAAMLYAMGMAEGALRDLLYKGDDEEEEDFNLFTSSFVFFASYIPFLGSLIESAAQGTRAQPPLLRVASTGVGGAKDMLTAEDEAKQLKGGLKVAESALSLGVGMPGTAQLFDLIDYATEED